MEAGKEELLRKVLDREIDPGADDVVAAASDDDGFAELLSATVELRDGLDRLCAEQHHVLLDAAKLCDEPGEPAVRQFVRDRVRVAAARRSRRRWTAVLAMAAVLAILVVQHRQQQAQEVGVPDDITLSGSAAARDMQPRGPVANFRHFTFIGDPGSGWFVIKVFDGKTDAPLPGGESNHLEEPSWRPDPATESMWPDHIRWELHTFDASGGTPRPPDSADAYRSP